MTEIDKSSHPFADHFAGKEGGVTGYAFLMDAVASGKSTNMGAHLKRVASYLGDDEIEDIIASEVVPGAQKILDELK